MKKKVFSIVKLFAKACKEAHGSDLESITLGDFLNKVVSEEFGENVKIEKISSLKKGYKHDLIGSDWLATFTLSFSEDSKIAGKNTLNARREEVLARYGWSLAKLQSSFKKDAEFWDSEWQAPWGYEYEGSMTGKTWKEIMKEGLKPSAVHHGKKIDPLYDNDSGLVRHCLETLRDWKEWQNGSGPSPFRDDNIDAQGFGHYWTLHNKRKASMENKLKSNSDYKNMDFRSQRQAFLDADKDSY